MAFGLAHRSEKRRLGDGVGELGRVRLASAIAGEERRLAYEYVRRPAPSRVTLCSETQCLAPFGPRL